MATILELKNAIAGVLGKTVGNLTVNGLDLGLMALNAVRLQAEQLNDFEFQRKLVTVSVNTATGGSLDNAVLIGTATSASIKTIIDVGQLDDNNNVCPVEWTSTAESLNRSRVEQPRQFRYPSDGQVEAMSRYRPRVTFTGDSVYVFPKTEVASATNITLAIEAFCYSPDWTATSNTVALTGSTGATGANTTYYRYGLYNGKPLYLSLDPSAGAPTNIYAIWYDTAEWRITLAGDIGSEGADYFTLTSTSQSPAGTYTATGGWGGTAVVAASETDSTSDIWTTKGYNYLLWASVVWLNHNDSTGKVFVPRTEGNLPPPQVLADAALAAFIQNDGSKFELFRTHGRV